MASGSELPRAYIVLKSGASLAVEQAMEHAEERLAECKRLDSGNKFIELILKNTSGKILKNTLREQAARELGTKLAFSDPMGHALP